MKQKCSNTFSLVALVDVILVTTMLHTESTNRENTKPSENPCCVIHILIV